MFLSSVWKWVLFYFFSSFFWGGTPEKRKNEMGFCFGKKKRGSNSKRRATHFQPPQRAVPFDSSPSFRSRIWPEFVAGLGQTPFRTRRRWFEEIAPQPREPRLWFRGLQKNEGEVRRGGVESKKGSGLGSVVHVFVFCCFREPRIRDFPFQIQLASCLLLQFCPRFSISELWQPLRTYWICGFLIACFPLLGECGWQESTPHGNGSHHDIVARPWCGAHWPELGTPSDGVSSGFFSNLPREDSCSAAPLSPFVGFPDCTGEVRLSTPERIPSFGVTGMPANNDTWASDWWGTCALGGRCREVQHDLAASGPSNRREGGSWCFCLGTVRKIFGTMLVHL